jgi:hypothetical protein
MKGQMHCMLSTLQSAGRSLKKRMHRVSAQMYLRATVQDGLLKDTPAAKVQISTSESGPKWRFKYILTAANFLLRKNKYGCLKCRLRDREAAVCFL